MSLEMIGVFRKEKGMTLDELSEKSGIPVSTIKKISAGITTDPNLSTVQAIASALGCTVDDLSNTSKFAETFSVLEKKIVKKYRALDTYGQDVVELVLEHEHRRCAEQAQEIQQMKEGNEPDNLIYITRWFPQPMSAGTGIEASDGYPEELELTKRPPRGTSYVAPVRGDSMEPTYHDGDKLFVHSCEEIEAGQIGVFLMDGKQWVKEQGDGVLISHNAEYAPIPMREDIRCQGLVLGVCDESYLG